MKLTFIGVGSAFTRKNHNSSAIMEFEKKDGEARRLLIDCGRTIPDSLYDFGLKWHDIDALYLTHAHADHAGGVEDFAFSRYFIPPKSKPKLFVHSDLVNDLWEKTLSGGLGILKEGIKVDLEEYFTVMATGKSFTYEGWDFEMIEVPHIMPTYALYISHPTDKDMASMLFSSDSQFTDILTPYYEKADVIFQDCEVTKSKSGVHAHITELRTLPEDIKKKMWLYHYQDMDELPDADGFAGYVRRGQSYEF